MLLPFFPVPVFHLRVCGFCALFYNTESSKSQVQTLITASCERNRLKCWFHMQHSKSRVCLPAPSWRFKLVAWLNFVTFSVVCGFHFPCFVKRDTSTKEWGLISLKLKLLHVTRWERWFWLVPWDFMLCSLSGCSKRLVHLCLPFLIAQGGLQKGSMQEDTVVMSSNKVSAAACSIKRRG